MAILHLAPYAERVPADSIIANKWTCTGTIILDTATEKYRQRNKSAVDPGIMDVRAMVKPGDKDLFVECVYRVIQYFGKEYQTIKESDFIDVFPKQNN